MKFKIVGILFFISFFSVVSPAQAKPDPSLAVLYQKIQSARCRLHNETAPWNTNKENWRSKLKCFNDSDPNFQKVVTLDILELAVNVASEQEVVAAFAEKGVK